MEIETSLPCEILIIHPNAKKTVAGLLIIIKNNNTLSVHVLYLDSKNGNRKII